MRYFPRIKIEIVKTKEDIELGVEPKKYQKKQRHNSYLMPKSFFKPKNHSSKKFTSISSGLKQNCTVKASYRTDKAAQIKNLQYIQSEGKALDGSKPELYGSNTQKEYENLMNDKSWRIILSPQSNEIDLTTLAREFIKKLENETGFNLTWLAANHFDTDNHHTHILINGMDKNGREVNFLPREKVTTLMREYAQDLCTNLIGYRQKTDIKEDYQKMVRKTYFTKLDKTLESLIDNNNEIGKEINKSANELILNQRLQFLVELQLAEYKKNKQKYILKNNWKEELKLLGKYNTYYDGFNYTYVSPQNYKMHEIKKDGPIEGTIVKKYTMQKDSNNFALVIKLNEDEARYVPLSFYPQDCFVGDKIRIDLKNKKTYIKNYSRKK